MVNGDTEVLWKRGTPKSCIYSWFFHYKLSFLAYHHFWNPPYSSVLQHLIPRCHRRSQDTRLKLHSLVQQWCSNGSTNNKSELIAANSHKSYPRCSMYGIFTYIWVIFGANVGKYSIHGASGICFQKFKCVVLDSHQLLLEWPSR